MIDAPWTRESGALGITYLELESLTIRREGAGDKQGNDEMGKRTSGTQRRIKIRKKGSVSKMCRDTVCGKVQCAETQ